MKRLLMAAALLILFMAGETPASTQVVTPFGAPDMRTMKSQMNGTMLLSLKEVRKELKLTPKQTKEIDAKQKEMTNSLQGGADPSNYTEVLKKMEAQYKAMLDILDADQAKRFHQLELQREGPVAVLQPQNAEELKLTAEQKEKMNDIQRKAQEELMAEMQEVSKSRDPRKSANLAKKMQASKKETGEKIAALLTEDQTKQWKEMQGKPFKFPQATSMFPF